MTEACIMGVDPGLKGAISFFFPSHPEQIAVDDMPVVASNVCPATLARRLKQMRPTQAVIEIVHAMPKQGVSSTFKFGDGFGCVRAVVAALEIPVHFVTPTTWKKHFRLTADKEESRRRAIELFPASSEHFARKKDDGRAEAALIARWFSETQGMRTAA